MENRVKFNLNQKAALTDFQNLGLFPQQSFDHLVGDLLVHSMKFTGFAPVATAAAVVRVGEGRFTRGGKIYYNDTTGGEPIDMTVLLPTVNRRWVAIVVSPDERDDAVEAR